jgi:chaperonin cofactor prefoldin
LETVLADVRVTNSSLSDEVKKFKELLELQENETGEKHKESKKRIKELEIKVYELES